MYSLATYLVEWNQILRHEKSVHLYGEETFTIFSLQLQFHFKFVFVLGNHHCSNYYSTNHAFVLAQKPDVSSPFYLMRRPQQTMWWESLPSAIVGASQNDTSQDLDTASQWPLTSIF